jgi:hypothetical protein
MFSFNLSRWIIAFVALMAFHCRPAPPHCQAAAAGGVASHFCQDKRTGIFIFAFGRIPAYGGVGLSGVPLRSIPFGNATRPSNPLRGSHCEAYSAGKDTGKDTRQKGVL